MRKIINYFLGFLNLRFFILLFLYFIFIVLFSKLVILFSKLDFIQRVDISIFNFIESLRDPVFTEFMKFITFFGNPEAVLLFTFYIIIYLFLKRRYDFIFILLSSSGIAGLTAILLKNFFERERPSFENALLYAGGFSFPSGHAMIAIAFYGILAYFIFISRDNKIEKIMVVVIGILLVFLISFSRVYLGVHFPSDIFGALILGFVWFKMMLYFFTIIPK